MSEKQTVRVISSLIFEVRYSLFPPIVESFKTYMNICTTVNIIKTKQLQHIYMIQII